MKKVEYSRENLLSIDPTTLRAMIVERTHHTVEIQLYEALHEQGLRSRMILQVHDEVVLQVPKPELDEVSALTREVMEQAYTLDIPLKVDAEVGENWFDMHEIT